jgi:hypothetical protein
MERSAVGSEFFHVDRHDEINSRFSQFSKAHRYKSKRKALTNQQLGNYVAIN